MSFQRAIAFVLKHEGGLVDDPRDPGGLTNMGIALKEHPNLTAEQIRSMTPQQASKIYADEYWTPIHGNDLPEAYHVPMLNAAVMAGPSESIIAVQYALHVRIDGEIGPDTTAALQTANAAATMPWFGAKFVEYLAELSDWKDYAVGWTARVIQSVQEAEYAT